MKTVRITTQPRQSAVWLVVAGWMVMSLSAAFGQSGPTGYSKATTTATSSTATSPSRGGNTESVQRGKAEHKAFGQDMKDSGRRTEVRMSNIETKQGARPD